MSVQLFKDLLASFKRSNKDRKLVLAKKAGYNTVNDYKSYLESMINGTNTEIKSKPTKKVTTKTTGIPTIHIVDIIDCSGSMGGSKINNANKGINDGVKELKKSDVANYIYTICDFSSTSDINFKIINQPIKDVPPVKFYDRGITALYDAIGETLTRVKKNVPKGEKVLVNIYTDGGENGSIKYSSEKVSSLIKELKEDYTVTFIGTSNDVANVSRALSIDKSNTLVYDGSASGLASSMTTNSVARTTYSKNVASGKDVSTGFYKNVVKK